MFGFKRTRRPDIGVPEALRQKGGAPYGFLIVPKDRCSTVSRRVRVASGLESSRLDTLDYMLMLLALLRRSLESVPWLFIAQAWRATFDQ